MKPPLLLDIDGVLCPFATLDAPDHFRREHFRYRDGAVDWAYVSDRLAGSLSRLRPRYDFTWCTSWEHDANLIIAPLMGLDPMPVIEFDYAVIAPDGHSYKFPAVTEFVGSRPFAWVDDEITDADFTWARLREAPTLLIRPDCAVGLTDDDLGLLQEYGEVLANADDSDGERERA